MDMGSNFSKLLPVLIFSYLLICLFIIAVLVDGISLWM